MELYSRSERENLKLFFNYSSAMIDIKLISYQSSNFFSSPKIFIFQYCLQFEHFLNT